MTTEVYHSHNVLESWNTGWNLYLAEAPGSVILIVVVKKFHILRLALHIEHDKTQKISLVTHCIPIAVSIVLIIYGNCIIWNQRERVMLKIHNSANLNPIHAQDLLSSHHLLVKDLAQLTNGKAAGMESLAAIAVNLRRGGPGHMAVNH